MCIKAVLPWSFTKKIVWDFLLHYCDSAPLDGGPLCLSSSLLISEECWGAQPRFEPGPTVGALSIELRHILETSL
jgi:hypothetical protein